MATELDFKKKLYAISSKLGQHELNGLKFLITNELPASTLERVKTSFELLCALEDAGRISSEDMSLLEVLLGHVQRSHLMKATPASFSLPPCITNAEIRCTESDLKEFLYPIANNLQQSDFKKLQCFFAQPTEVTYQEMEQIPNAMKLFDTLVTRHIITVEKLGLLWDVLKTIGRIDLCKKIEGFHLNPPVHSLVQETGPAVRSPPTSLPFESKPAVLSREETPNTASSRMVFSPSHSNHASLNITPECSLSSTSTVDYPSSNLMSTPNTDGGRLPGTHPIGGHDGSVLQPNITAQLSSQPHSGAKLVVGRRRAVCPQSKQTPEQQMREEEYLKTIEKQCKQLKQLNEQVKHLEAARSPTTSYPMKSKPHGLAYVFGNENFERNPSRPNLRLDRRLGTDIDVECFVLVFRMLDYEVCVCTDFTADEIKREVHRIAAVDHSAYDSVVFCFTTHGESNHYIFGSDSHTVDVYHLTTMVQLCPTLENKPKMFFIQACRVEPQDKPTVTSDGNPPEILHNPNADLFIAWATTRNSPAYRSSTYGSWFPVAMYKVFTQSANVYNLHTMMLKVNDMICSTKGVDEKAGSPAQQCVERNEQLRYDIVFFEQ